MTDKKNKWTCANQKRKDPNYKVKFSGVTMDPRLNHCDVPGCKNGACTSVWNYPGVPGRRQTNVCGWHVKELCG